MISERISLTRRQFQLRMQFVMCMLQCVKFAIILKSNLFAGVLPNWLNGTLRAGRILILHGSVLLLKRCVQIRGNLTYSESQHFFGLFLYPVDMVEGCDS